MCQHFEINPLKIRETCYDGYQQNVKEIKHAWRSTNLLPDLRK
jgi:hypothetical protein